MANVVLVGGSWLGAWAWRNVTPLLRQAGHEVYPVTLTGFGDRTHLGTPQTDLSVHAQDVVAVIKAEELTDVVLVGHSYAGAVVTAVADLIPELLAKVVYLAAATPQDGQSLFDLQEGMEEIMQGFADAEGDGWRVPFIGDEILNAFYGEHGLSTEDLEWLRRHTSGQPIASYREPLRLTNLESVKLPRTFIHCLGDGEAYPLPDYGQPWTRLELNTGHWPMVTKPAELAELLDQATRS